MTSIFRKITVVVIYLIVLTLLWLSIRYRYGKTTEMFKSKERFDGSGDSGSNYTYGTLLRNIPIVNEVAKKFTSVRPQKFKDPGGFMLEMPKEFNGPDVWKDYLSPITEQGKCGNCWAHSSASVLADRFAILSLGKIKFIPSPYDLTICGAYQFTDITKQWGNVDELKLMDDYFQGRKVDPNNKLQSAACEGAALYTAANILYTEGVTDINCFPGKAAPKRDSAYDVNMTSVGNSNDLPYCYKLQTVDFDTCVDQKTAMRKYRAKTAYNVGDPQTDSLDQLELAIQHEIYRNGPVVSGFVVFDDFMDPTQFDGKTVYQHKNKSAGSNGGHAIRVCGWGEETIDGEVVPYWWIANSWGTQWGINGYFKMKRKMRECQLEMNAMGMLPDFPGMEIVDENIVPIETAEEINIREFTKHYLHPISGFYTSALDKVRSCKLAGDTTPYVDQSFEFPDYKTFYAAEIKEYLKTKPLTESKPLQPLVTCSTSSTDSSSTQVDDAISSGGVVQPSSGGGIVQPTPPSSGGVVQPTPTPPLAKQTKVCISESPNIYTKSLDKISTHRIILDISYGILAVLGTVVIWKILGDDNKSTPSSTIPTNENHYIDIPSSTSIPPTTVPTIANQQVNLTPSITTPPISPFLASIPSLKF